jgi:hypothetical protein
MLHSDTPKNYSGLGIVRPFESGGESRFIRCVLEVRHIFFENFNETVSRRRIKPFSAA